MQKKKEKPDQCKRLSIFRKAKKLTQAELAEVLQTDQSTISSYESGRLFIPPDLVKILNKNYGLSYDWFYNGVGKMDNLQEVTDKTNNSDLGTLQTTIQQLEIRVKKLELLIQKLNREIKQGS